MSVAVFITSESEAHSLIPWGIQVAKAENTNLLLFCPRKSKGKIGIEEFAELGDAASSLQQAIFKILKQQDPDQIVWEPESPAGDEESQGSSTRVRTLEVISPYPESTFVDQANDYGISLLVVSVFQPLRGGAPTEKEWEEVLFETAHWGMICIRGPLPNPDHPANLLFASEGDEDQDDVFALETTASLGRSFGGKVTLLYVRPSDDLVAHEVAQRHLDRLERRIQSDNLKIVKHAELRENLIDGINQLDLKNYDLVVIGTRNKKEMRRLLGQLKTLDNDRQLPLAIMRQAVPLLDKLWDRTRHWVRSIVPQIGRDHRVALVDRLNSSSHFNFDFLALMSLSTMIAALGLALNSTAVVIGAMLVAPLMTPLVAIGLALVQGNLQLIRSAIRSVLLGFSVALVIGIIIGLFLRLTEPGLHINREMLSRGSPNLLDLMVALASGVAAAYAMGRPHLISALPGVAIAAALVPPIATAGLAFSLGQWSLGGGATLLFLTNIVSIALGTAITFWSVGISTHEGGPADASRRMRSWPRYVFLGFVAVSFFLAWELNHLGGTPVPQRPQQNESADSTPNMVSPSGLTNQQ